MGYEILRDDLGKNKSEPKPSKKKMKKIPQIAKVNPVYIHIALIIVIIGLLFLYFLDDVSFDYQTSQQQEVITLIGSLNEFNESYSGDILVVADNFKLETPTGEFDVVSAEIEIEDFNGSVYLNENLSIVLDGTSKKIEYGKNKINLNGQKFKFTSGKKVSMNLFFDKLNLDFNDGRIKIDESFNYDFENTNISVSGFNSSLKFDGTFLFAGPTNELNLLSKSPKLSIKYIE